MELDPTTIFVWRAVERIIGIIIAGILVYLGYKLFINLPEKTDSEGKVILPGNISIYLSRIGPGAFFALFGAIIVGLSVITQLKYSPDGISILASNIGPRSDSTNSESIVYLDQSNSTVNVADMDSYRSQLLKHIEKLNTLGEALDNYLDGKNLVIEHDLAIDVQIAMPHLKKNLLLSAWKEEWGSQAEFVRWVNMNSPDPPPEGIEQVAKLFQKK